MNRHIYLAASCAALACSTRATLSTSSTSGTTGSSASSATSSGGSSSASGATSSQTTAAASTTAGGTATTSTTTTGTTTRGTTGTTSGTTTSSGSGSTSGVIPIGGDSVLMHHKNPSRDGLYIESNLTKAAISTLHVDPSFAPSLLVGDVYAQPLFVDRQGSGQGGPDLVIVATEAANVYALDATTGAQVWMKNVGTPVPISQLLCGNIDTVGITGTPVIDPATRTLFFDSELLVSGADTHQVFALSVDDGSIRPGWPVDIPTMVSSGATTFTAAAQGERGALAVLDGNVYVPFGGRYGDCSPYHGWVVGISIANPQNVQAWATTASAGGVWMPSGIATDGTSLFVSTGNTFTSGGGTWGGGDAFINLSPGATLGMSAYFSPKNWFNLDNGDEDMGTGPVVFDLPGSTPSALAILFGKDTNAYLVDRNNPGGVGSALGANAAMCTASTFTGSCSSLASVATAEIISAAVVYTTPTATYVAVRGNGAKCTHGTSGDLLALTINPGSPPTLAASWCGAGGAGAPMVTTSDGHADAIVWTLGADGDSRLHGFDGDTGTPIVFTGDTTALPGVRRFNTPIAAKGRIFVPVDAADGGLGVVAFTL